MRWSWLAVLVVLAVSKGALAQVPLAPATEPAPAADAAAPQPAPSDAAPSDAAPGEPAAPPTPTAAPEPAPPAEPVPSLPAEPGSSATAVPPPPPSAPPVATPTPATDTGTSTAAWVRAHEPLTLEAHLGGLLRPGSSSGFQDQTHAGAAFGLSLYLDLSRKLAAGLVLDRSSLGRATALSGLTSVNVDHSVTSAMLGLRAYAKRTELFDLFIGVQLGAGLQTASATGTESRGPLLSPVPYACHATDTPGLQLGAGAGARLMFTPRWGVSAQVDGVARRLTGEVIDNCAQGIGGTTTLTAGVGFGYDFDLDP